MIAAKLPGFVLEAQIYAFGTEALHHHVRYLGVLARHNAFGALDLRHVAPEARETLRQLAADRPATQYQQALGQGTQIPDGIGGEIAYMLDTRDIRYKRASAGGEHNVAGGQGTAVHLDAVG